MIRKKTIKQTRARRHGRVRSKIKGTSDRPRLSVYRSNTSLRLQLIDDQQGKTIAEFLVEGKNKEAAKRAGEGIAQAARKKGITRVVFDRGGYRYHGGMKEIADAVRKDGIVV